MLTQVTQISKLSDAPPRCIKVLSLGWFCEQHIPMQSAGSDASIYCYLCAPRSVGHFCKHMCLTRLCKRHPQQPTDLLPLCLSGGQKYSTRLQISFVKDAQKAVLKNACNFYLQTQWTEVSAALLQGLCQKHKGSSLHSFSWTSGRLQKVWRILSVWESFISCLPKMFVLESIFH